MTAFGGRYRGRRVLVTGHTGFKGSWLAAWLQRLGAEVYGYSLAPASDQAHWHALQLSIDATEGDLADAERLTALIRRSRPEIVFHLAAQPLVRKSYAEPLVTWATNVMGTAHLLEACRHESAVRAIVAVTTDKVYANREWNWGYREIDALGGHDPYSAAKAAMELLCDSYRQAFYAAKDGPLLATARAGNVIGGGDWSVDRLLPDAWRALRRGEELQIRSPNAIRPWQHVLDCLSGYLLIGQRLLEGDSEVARAWNLGPAVTDTRRVAEVLLALTRHWPELRWRATDGAGELHETGQLQLDSAQARSRLGWLPVWTFDQALTATAEWYWQQASGRLLTFDQLDAYRTAATGAVWTRPCN
ncbi:MAG: CDP-glucose 4,6-dehydratase [Pseudomonas sp. PGPPP4]|uniref:CDP-glucose 4,6-dehydratase n=1 Tax=Pseudomonas TaxID=286 RepID=UPI000BDB5553|nr:MULTISPECIES: CDP-glucose 4,6-dehydratase [Pseudomonas]NMZ63072.1 CDP-glucose 4,6-dehydratase [Pseudomonas oryzihabitans]OYT81981.1 MAG: CDP-glucose 4,6-dehydratase [Pseudomonas sp. PGPPP4]